MRCPRAHACARARARGHGRVMAGKVLTRVIQGLGKAHRRVTLRVLPRVHCRARPRVLGGARQGLSRVTLGLPHLRGRARLGSAAEDVGAPVVATVRLQRIWTQARLPTCLWLVALAPLGMDGTDLQQSRESRFVKNTSSTGLAGSAKNKLRRNMKIANRTAWFILALAVLAAGCLGALGGYVIGIRMRFQCLPVSLS